MELCLISKETMEHEIKLPCNHSFEYIYLYHEIIQQKKTSTKGFNCPYCRAFYEHSIPYYELEGIEKKTKINYHPSKTLPLLTCLLCSSPGHLFTHGCYCISHSKLKRKCLGVCKTGQPCKNNADRDLYCKIHSKNNIGV